MRHSLGKLLLLVAILSLVIANASFSHSETLTARGFILGTLVQSQSGDSRGDPPGGDVSWDTVIVEAVVAGDIDKVTTLLTRGSGPNATHKDGGSALRWAAYYGRKEIAKLLLSRGADVKIEKGGKMGNALIRAVILGDEQLATQLIDKDADVNSAAQVGETALHWACIMGHKDLVRLLVEKGASVNAVSRGGCTLLVSAVIGEDPEIVRFLIAQGTGPIHPARWEFALATGDIARILEAHKSDLESRQGPQAEPAKTEINNGSDFASSSSIPGQGLVWQVKLGEGDLYQPVVADRTVYVVRSVEKEGVSKSYLHGMDLVTGKERSQIKLGLRNVWIPKIDHGFAYFGGLDGASSLHHVCAVDLTTGAEKWRFKTRGQMVWISSIAGGVAYFGCFGGWVYAVDALTGNEKWKYEVPRSFPQSEACYVSPPTVANRTIFFGTGQLYGTSRPGYVVALDAGTGREKWRLKTWTRAFVYPVVQDTIYAACADGEILTIDPVRGSKRWSFNSKAKAPNLAYATIIHATQNRVYVQTTHGSPGAYTRDARIIALDSMTGTELFEVRTEAESFSFPCWLIRGRLYMMGSDGCIYVLNPDAGGAIYKVRYGGTYATVAYGAALCVNKQGTLYAVDLDKAACIKVSQ